MSTQTTNFGLNKDEGNNWYDINKVNSNTDIIDTALGNTAKFEKAGGTATAITVTGVTIADGRSKTFIVKANNNGTATTINGKPLYKPGTTSAPSLTTGKAVTVWYDLTDDCFFIKASAEGDAVAANVLAGKKFSNDNDTGITGIMANNGAVTLTPGTSDQVITSGYHNGSGKVVGDADLISANIKAGVDIFGVAGKASVVDTADANAVAGNILSGKTGYVNGAKITGTIASKAAATITPGTTDQTIAAGQYLSGTQTIKGDANLIPANIAKGKAIYNVDGTLDNRLINFPLSIQDAEPSPIRTGHIWVKSDTLESQITKVKILEALNVGETEGTLMLVVGDLALHSFSVANSIDITNGGTKQVSAADTISSTTDWDILSKTGDVTASFKINKPLVYSKVNGLLYIEDAYVWNGTSWAVLSQKGRYLVYPTTSGLLNSFNRVEDNFVSNAIGLEGRVPRFTANGQYMITTTKVYKLIGDVFTLYYTLPISLTYSGSPSGNYGIMDWDISTDGNTLYAVGCQSISSTYNYVFFVLTNNGSEFTLSQQILIDSGISSHGYNYHSRIHCVNNGALLLISIAMSNTNTGILSYFRNADGTYTSTRKYISSPPLANFFLPFFNICVIGATLYLFGTYYSSSNGYTFCGKYTIDFVDKKVNYASLLYSNGAYYDIDENTNKFRSVVLGDIILTGFTSSSNTVNMWAYNYVDGVTYTVNVPSQLSSTNAVSFYGIAVSADQARVAIARYVTTGYVYYDLYSYSINKSVKTIALTWLKQITSTNSYVERGIALL